MKKILLLLSLSLLLANCGQPMALSTVTGSSIDCSNDACFTAKAKKVQIVISHRQVLPNFVKCLNLPDAKVSATTKNTLADSTSSLSLEGSVSDVSAPMLMAVTKVVGELCNDLIQSEKANLTTRTYFAGYKLGTSNTQAYSFANTLKSFATACWGRAATDDEIAVIVSSYGTATQDTAEAIYGCTAMLSSSQAIKF